MRDAEDGDVGVEPGQVGLERRAEEARRRWIGTHEPERSSGRVGPLAGVGAVTAAADEGDVPDVDLEAVVRSKGLGDGRRPGRSHLPRRTALRTVEMAVLRRREDVELLATIGAMAVADQSELLQHVERAIDRRRNGRRVARRGNAPPAPPR